MRELKREQEEHCIVTKQLRCNVIASDMISCQVRQAVRACIEHGHWSWPIVGQIPGCDISW